MGGGYWEEVAGMTSKKLAELAMDQMQTLALIGEERRCLTMGIRVLGLISQNHNSIPDSQAWNALCENPVKVVLPADSSEAGGAI